MRIAQGPTNESVSAQKIPPNPTILAPEGSAVEKRSLARSYSNGGCISAQGRSTRNGPCLERIAEVKTSAFRALQHFSRSAIQQVRIAESLQTVLWAIHLGREWWSRYQRTVSPMACLSGVAWPPNVRSKSEWSTTNGSSNS